LGICTLTTIPCNSNVINFISLYAAVLNVLSCEFQFVSQAKMQKKLSIWHCGIIATIAYSLSDMMVTSIADNT
jgi:hypothetical protein